MTTAMDTVSPARIEPGAEPDRQQRRDAYYMSIADAVRVEANCLGSHVGALVVLENRIIGSGYNGTPSGFQNCNEGGCVRCRDSKLIKQGRLQEATDPAHVSGQALDRCICVHAEQNALLTAARFGIRVDRATLYATQSPCFGCLKEALQAGISRIVFREPYRADYNEALRRQYQDLANHLPVGMNSLDGAEPLITVEAGPPDDPFTEAR
jgi:dCMP deaminase